LPATGKPEPMHLTDDGVACHATQFGCAPLVSAAPDRIRPASQTRGPRSHQRKTVAEILSAARHVVLNDLETTISGDSATRVGNSFPRVFPKIGEK
jgi:hypothetical protein